VCAAMKLLLIEKLINKNYMLFKKIKIKLHEKLAEYLVNYG